MMQVQMPKFAKISSDFICIYEKIAVGRGSSNCCLSLYLNIAGIWQGPGKMLLGSWKSTGNFCNQESGNCSNKTHTHNRFTG